MPNTWHLSRYKLLTFFTVVGLISVALLFFATAPSEGETITGTVGKPGAVGTAYNYVDADYSNEYTQDGLLYWPRTVAYRAGKGTSQYNKPQTVSVTYQVFQFYRGDTSLVGSKKVSMRLGTTKESAYSPSAFMWVENIDTFNYGYGYWVKTYVSWKNSNTNALIAARTFTQNDTSDYRCRDYNNNGGRCEITRFQDANAVSGDAYVRIWGVN
jgi:hypothetical protein